jgi:hypothetical protein
MIEWRWRPWAFEQAVLLLFPFDITLYILFLPASLSAVGVSRIGKIPFAIVGVFDG